MQRLFGNPYIPKKPGSPPWSRMKVSAILSNSNGMAPGTMYGASSPKVLLTSCALVRINSISSVVLYLIITLKSVDYSQSFQTAV